jgi:hypothetical protein
MRKLLVEVLAGALLAAIVVVCAKPEWRLPVWDAVRETVRPNPYRLKKVWTGTNYYYVRSGDAMDPEDPEYNQPTVTRWGTLPFHEAIILERWYYRTNQPARTNASPPTNNPAQPGAGL